MACNNSSLLNLLMDNENILGDAWGTVFGVLMALIAVISTLENLLILVALCKYMILRRASDNKILISLVFSYLLIGLIVCPLFTVQLLFDFSATARSQLQAERINKICVYTGIIAYGASVLTLAFLCYERYRHLVRIDNHFMRKTTIYGCLLIIWFLPIILVLLTERYYVFRICKLGTIITILFLILIAVTCIFFITMALQNHAKHEANIAHWTYMEKERKSARTAVIMILVCVLLIIPSLVFYGGWLFIDAYTKLVHPRAYLFSCIFCFIISIINPAYVAYRTLDIRKCLIRMLHIPDLCKEEVRSNISSSTNDSDLQISRENSTQFPAIYMHKASVTN